MTSNPAQERDREVPEDASRKQILVYESVRDYLRERSDINGCTYSEQLAEWLPDDADLVLEHPDDTIVNIKATPGVHEKVAGMAGKRVSPGDVVALYTMVAALENGDLERATEFADSIPNAIWDVLEVAGGPADG